MAIITNYPNDFDPENPYSEAYAWTSALGLNLFEGSGSVVLTVNSSEANWAAKPLGQVMFSLGEKHGDVQIQTLAELLQDQEFAAAFDIIGRKIYAEALKLPVFQGGKIV